jgi:biopolymer transport protein ExbB/TolQ
MFLYPNFAGLMDALAYLTRGGVVMIPLLLCSVLGLAIIPGKIDQLHRRRILHPESFA